MAVRPLAMTHPSERPVVFPFCQSCGVPAESYSFVGLDAYDRISLEVQCHGKTEFVSDNLGEAVKRGHILAFKKPHGFNGILGLVR